MVVATLFVDPSSFFSRDGNVCFASLFVDPSSFYVATSSTGSSLPISLAGSVHL
jgi:hypothetical protein